MNKKLSNYYMNIGTTKADLSDLIIKIKTLMLMLTFVLPYDMDVGQIKNIIHLRIIWIKHVILFLLFIMAGQTQCVSKNWLREVTSNYKFWRINIYLVLNLCISFWISNHYFILRMNLFWMMHWHNTLMKKQILVNKLIV